MAAKPAAAQTESSTDTSGPSDNRYGFFGLFDYRSKYATNWYPEPFNADEADWDQEFRVEWTHLEKSNEALSDTVNVEVEKSFGLWTFEVEAPYERNVDFLSNQSQAGIGNVDVAVRHPIYQYVSDNEFLDYTFGARMEVGIPTNSPVGKNAELICPGIYNCLGLGDHFSVQSVVGYSTLYGSGDDGGNRTVEYAAWMGYNIEHDQLPLPYVMRVVPVFELDGKALINKGNGDPITGTAGLSFNFDSIDIGQPKLLLGYTFPLDQDARDQMNWGVVVSVRLEY
jgi:hypothetical protein